MPASSLVTSLRALLAITQVMNRFLGVHVSAARKSSPGASSTLHAISPARPLSSGLMVFERFCFADLQTARLKLASHSIAMKRRESVTAWALSAWVSKIV